MNGASMRRFEGIAAAGGIASGRVRILQPRLVIADRRIGPHQVAGELERLDSALEVADRQLQELGAQLVADRAGSDLVDVHRLILRSDEIVKEVRRLVSGEGLASETAVRRVIRGLVSKFEGMGDEYQRERGSDVEAVGERLVRSIVRPAEPAEPAEDAGKPALIAVGAQLSAVEAFRLPRAGVIGLVTEGGGKTSHLSIILRSLELPYVAGVGPLLDGLRSGTRVIVDGSEGRVIVDPDEATRLAYVRRARRHAARDRRLLSSVGKPAVTADGTRVELAANIDALSEIDRAIGRGAESIGLLRTELLYLDRPDLPSEDEQYRDALAALAALGGRTATFRTLDLGGDKLPLAVPIPSGPNPSLGVRAIRFSARRPEIFHTQLRALYRASAGGPLRILFPMISGVAEMQEVRAIAGQVQDELARDGLPFRPDVPLGAMIETPSAALTVDHLSDHCDFFSIGTNDLIQYAFAADRDNREVHYLYQPLHPAVLRLLARAIQDAGAAGKPISLCGDMAGDPAFASVLLGLGLRSFSMIPAAIPAVRAVISGGRLADAQVLARQALAGRSAVEVEALVAAFMAREFPPDLDTPDPEPWHPPAGLAGPI
jgi:phosphotransferase system enzyme I (PtsI)